MMYPRNVFSVREDVTRAAMQEWKCEQERLHSECLKANPNYDKLDLRERLRIRAAISLTERR